MILVCTSNHSFAHIAAVVATPFVIITGVLFAFSGRELVPDVLRPHDNLIQFGVPVFIGPGQDELPLTLASHLVSESLCQLLLLQLGLLLGF